MRTRLLPCGKIGTECECPKCNPSGPDQVVRGTTKQRGYDNRWRKLSERERKRRLCEVHQARGQHRLATALHHIEKIRDAPHLRLEVENTLAVCDECHQVVEGMSRSELEKYLGELAESVT